MISELFEHGWTEVPFTIAGEKVGSLALKGVEVHFSLGEGYRPKGSSRGAIRKLIAPLLEKRGYLTTRVLKERTAQQRFIERLGFKKTGDDGTMLYYMLSAEPFNRRKPL